jgi:hypothetical protein
MTSTPSHDSVNLLHCYKSSRAAAYVGPLRDTSSKGDGCSRQHVTCVAWPPCPCRPTPHLELAEQRLGRLCLALVRRLQGRGGRLQREAGRTQRCGQLHKVQGGKVTARSSSSSSKDGTGIEWCWKPQCTPQSSFVVPESAVIRPAASRPFPRQSRIHALIQLILWRTCCAVVAPTAEDAPALLLPPPPPPRGWKKIGSCACGARHRGTESRESNGGVCTS